MDNRWSPRTDVSLGVDLFCSGKAIEGCSTRDIGMGGVFINLDEDVPSKDTLVELIFSLEKGGEAINHRIDAKVVRPEAQGAGMEFRNFDANAFRSLQEILHYAQDQKAD